MKFGEVLEILSKDHSKVFIDYEDEAKVYINDMGDLEYEYLNGSTGKPNLPGAWFDYEWEEYVEEGDWNWKDAVSNYVFNGNEKISKLKQKILDDIKVLGGKSLYGYDDLTVPFKQIINRRFGF